MVRSNALNLEKFRSLGAKLARLVGPRKNIILITSSFEKQGKSTLALGLATAMSEFNSRVLLVDADLRRGQLTQWIDSRQVGLNEWSLSGPPPLKNLNKDLDFIASGEPTKTSPLDILSEPSLRDWLELLSLDYHIVLVDSPSLVLSKDALKLASFCPYSLFVTAKRAFQGIPEGNHCEDLRDQGSEVIGLVVTE